MREVAILLLITFVLAAAVFAQEDCSQNSCHPQLGDLLIGRSGQLSATSTCGLNRPQKYCILGHLEEEQKCFTCDSRYPYNRYNNPISHQIENIITTFESDRKMKWWQSENGVDHVSIRLDLEAVFQFSHLVLTFKTFRPAAMVVERSKDNGQTWKVFRYFAQDCASSFPFVPTGPARRIDDVICDSRYSSTEPSTDGEVILKALDPSFNIENPYDPHIQELITLTNLRVNFTKLITLGDNLLVRRKRNPEEKYYYALYEMIVRGSCFCNGHASQCMPVDNARGDVFREQGMVHGSCVCQHNTEGLNCERCKEFYNDAPWKPAETSNINACKRCNCNLHSDRCHFDMAVYLSNGGVSGGVCEDCQHNTIGANCEQCRPFFYQDPLRPISDPYVCQPCDCDPEGSINNGLCEPATNTETGAIAGRCKCKENVEWVRCDRCKPGFFGLSRDDPQGCQYCRCNRLGSVLTPSPCDPVTGECICQRFATGPLCDHCLPGYWGLGNTVYGCSLCDCDIGGAYNDKCLETDGQCQCLPHIVGRKCNEPAPGYFFAPLDYYIYEAEYASPLEPAALLVNPIPPCDRYFRERGYDFKFENGKFILTRITKRSIRERRQLQQNTIPLDPGYPLQIVFRERIPDKPVTWTGPGFVRVRHGAGLRFSISNLPASLNYSVVIRYEPESSDNWIAEVTFTSNDIPLNGQCADQAFQTKSVPLLSTGRIAILDIPICLDHEGYYYFDIYFKQYYTSEQQPNSHILIDSMGLIPRIESLQNFCSKNELDAYQHYECIEIASEVGIQILPDVCQRLVASMSARIHNGAVACKCNTEGSVTKSCSKFGGQCECKPHVIGRCCNTCAPKTFGFGPSGCTLCNCDPQGSYGEMCDQVSGQCPCRRQIFGRQCNQCQQGYFGFPNCQPCQCNGKAEFCDPVTGACLNCRDFTTGKHCERCLDGYYGDPKESCTPCLCPDTKASGRYFAHSCHKDYNALQVICDCIEGYVGSHCDKCPQGYYGSLKQLGDRCLPCPCNNNIDVLDVGSCDRLTGVCLKCLYNTEGPNCQFCKKGYFGSALTQTCTACACNPFGTHSKACPSPDLCVCDETTGQCPCLPNVTGKNCEECAPGYWDMASGEGCQPCDCDPRGSLGTQCNQFTGQCVCQPGFGGKRCDQCEENFFGDPGLKCLPCNCNTEGTEKPVCDQYTGACNCRTGIVGRFCDQCARGFLEEFPKCTPCHPCFKIWDQEVDNFQPALQKLNLSASSLHTDKLPTYDKKLTELEEKHAALQNLLNGSLLSMLDIQEAEFFCDKIRQLTDGMDPNLIIIDATTLLNSEINSIRKELDLHIETLENKMKWLPKFNVEKLLAAFNSIKKHYEESNKAEERIKNTKITTDTSENTRKKVSELLDKTNLKKTLDDLEKKLNELNVAAINEKVCGAPGDAQCSIATCGGALCKDEYGNRKCGGIGCKGSLPIALNATEEARQTDIKISKFLNQLKDSKREIADTKVKVKETQKKASDLIEKITKNKERIEQDKEKTKALIQKVKDFLTGRCPCIDTGESLDPEDIEKVARAVLSIKLPESPEDFLKKLKDSFINSTEFENELKFLKEQNDKARKLLEQAKKVQKKADSVDPTEAKTAIEEANNANARANESIKKIQDKVQEINENIDETEEKLNTSEDSLMDIMNRLGNLSRDIEQLRNKTEQNRQMAEDVKLSAEDALGNATEIEKDFKTAVTLYEILKSKQKGQGVSKEAQEKAEKLRKEAEDLAKDIADKMQTLAELEDKIKELIKNKEEKANEVSELEAIVKSIRDEIIEKGIGYSTCQL
uniref:Laminin subunit beta-1 n=1 Tax=Erpetoichthys calabaricus TaxID=27687 RepID=A0A8C4RHI6_ERPCA